jgi:hypothetical protein
MRFLPRSFVSASAVKKFTAETPRARRWILQESEDNIIIEATAKIDCRRVTENDEVKVL